MGRTRGIITPPLPVTVAQSSLMVPLPMQATMPSGTITPPFQPQVATPSDTNPPPLLPIFARTTPLTILEPASSTPRNTADDYAWLSMEAQEERRRLLGLSSAQVQDFIHSCEFVS